MKKNPEETTVNKSKKENKIKELKKLMMNFSLLVKEQKKEVKAQEKLRGTIERAFKENAKRTEALEDSLLHLMHNIKKNQFLYAHYPEDWVKDYLSIKKGIKYENLFMDKKIADQELANEKK